MSVGVFLLLSVSGCGKGRGEQPSAAAPEPDQTPAPIEASPENFKGAARFGGQCPYGTFAPTQEVPLELWNCPTGLPLVELKGPLEPLILQADCKKKTLDVRGPVRSLNATTWEVMPDGSFYFTLETGSAILKNDGAGHSNCSVPLSANFWGRIDCTDRDKAVIRIETVWWLAKTTQPAPVPHGTLRHSASGVLSSFDPPPWAVSPSSSPTTSPTSFPSSRPSSFPSGSPSSIPSPRSTVPECKLPQGCYFHNITKMNQCS